MLVDNIPSPAGNHNAGDLQFGKDGNLYVSVGDGGCDYAGDSGCAGQNDAARDRTCCSARSCASRHAAASRRQPVPGRRHGALQRTGRTTAGTQVPGDLRLGPAQPVPDRLRPERRRHRFLINDVGQNTWEEIDLGAAGADYGWNVREGHCATGSTTNCGPPPAGMTNPIYAYGHAGGCASITGGAFVPDGVWPAAYDGAYLFGDYVCGKIFQLDARRRRRLTRTDFATGVGVGRQPRVRPVGARARRSTTRPTRAAARSGASSRHPRQPAADGDHDRLADLRRRRSPSSSTAAAAATRTRATRSLRLDFGDGCRVTTTDADDEPHLHRRRARSPRR